MSSSIKRPVDDSGDTSYDRFALLSKQFRGLKVKGGIKKNQRGKNVKIIIKINAKRMVQTIYLF